MSLPENREAQPPSPLRYPGTRSFSDDSVDTKLFFGREDETQSLLDRVRANRMLVLFGKSGLGKTSLLQAGLFPRLRALGMLPVSVRLDQVGADPVETVIAAVQAACVFQRIDCTAGGHQGLWSFFKTTDLWRDETLLTPVLVLDQFEEIFTLQDNAFRHRLAGELGDLLRPGLPPAQRMLRARGERMAYSDGLPELRVILSLREEWVGALEDLVADVPAIFDQRFQLTPLTLERARRAVEEPAKVVDEIKFRSYPFVYDEVTLDQMIKFLANRLGEVEPFQLQVLCQHVEHQVLERQAGKDVEVRVDNGLLGGQAAMETVQTRFYKHALGHVTRWQQRRRAQRLCELGLLSPEGRRLSLEEEMICRRYKLKPATLVSLVEARLVRRDTRPGLEGFYYELSHDSLAAPVLSARRWRLVRQTALVAGLLLLSFGPVIWALYQEVQASRADLASLSVEITSQRVEIASQRAEIVSQIELASKFQDIQNLQAAVKSLLELSIFRDRLKSGGEGPDMVPILAREFLMGSPNTEEGRYDDERQHQVTLIQDFALGVREVTRGEFQRFVSVTGYKTEERNNSRVPGCRSWNGNVWVHVVGASWRKPGFQQTDDHPVVCVSWNDAMAYTQWLSKETGKSYRLPTEAEWEFGARAGATTARYWGAEPEAACKYANVAGLEVQKEVNNRKKHACDDGFVYTAPTGSFVPNDFGLMDMLGNSWEWTCSAYEKSYLEEALKCGVEEGARVLRGGSWTDDKNRVRASFRNWNTADIRDNNLGFRLAQEL